MRALRRFTVRAELPAPLAALNELVMNLRWSWHPPTVELFTSIDPDLWRLCGHDPVRLLGEVSATRVHQLAADTDFLRRLRETHNDLTRYLTEPRWFQELEGDKPQSVAYFSPEFGIAEVLPQYSGGLGILAGDHLKTASDLGVPIVGVGLLYRSGYFRQSLTDDGWQLEQYPLLDPSGLPLTRLTDAAGNPIQIAVDLPDERLLRAHIWRAQVGRVPLLLLDSDIEENAPSERQVTDRLYGGGSEHRLAQELLLGIGGVRAVRAFCDLTQSPSPDVFHTNEGHAGFLGLERIREMMENDGLSFDEALAATRSGTVFTTHTPVEAGIDRFDRGLIASAFGGSGPSAVPGVPLERIHQLGSEDNPNVFNMAYMGLRLAQRANGVSKLHGHVSREMFGGLWRGFPADEVPIGSVTNGVHAPTWVASEVAALVGEYGEKTDRVDPARLWRLRRTLRERLVAEVRRRLRESMLKRGQTAAELGWVDSVFDPDVMTIGFARRVPQYKRLTLMLRDRDRLKAALLHPERPVQLVIAGKAHPADEAGKQLIQQMVQFADDPEVRHRIVFLPDYDIGMAQYLYWGCDIWLNNPLRPLEACGTSGMKAALNGGLNLSIRDGWWDEMFDGENGWAIPTADGVPDPERRDDLEAAALYELIEAQVAPLFYGSSRDSVPSEWVEMVRHTIASLTPQVQAARMLDEYVRELYAPAALAARALAADKYSAAKELAAWQEKVHTHWSEVEVTHVESSGLDDAPVLGNTLHVRAEVVLGELAPTDVAVQACFGAVDESDALTRVQSVTLQCVGNDEEAHHFEGDIPLQKAGTFGYTVRVVPTHALLASEVELGLMAVA